MSVQPWTWALLALVLVAPAIELLRRRLLALSDERTAQALRWSVPLATGVIAGATNGFTYLVLVSGRAFARQVGLPDDDWRVQAFVPFAFFISAIPLLASPVLERRLPGREGLVRLRASFLLAGGIGLCGMAIAPSLLLLYVVTSLAGLFGAGAIMLKCEVAAAAHAGGHLESSLRWMGVGFVPAAVLFPFGASLLARTSAATGEAGASGVHGFAFVGLGALCLAAMRLAPAMLRVTPEPPASSTQGGPGDKLVFRAIALATISIAALGPIDAGLVWLIADHGHAEAELWAGLALLASLPLALLAPFLARAMRNGARVLALVGAGMALSGALVGWSVSSASGVAWAIGFAPAYWSFELATTLLLLVCEWIALRDPTNYSRVALLSGIRQVARALAGLAFPLLGEGASWMVATGLCLAGVVVAYGFESAKATETRRRERRRNLARRGSRPGGRSLLTWPLRVGDRTAWVTSTSVTRGEAHLYVHGWGGGAEADRQLLLLGDERDVRLATIELPGDGGRVGELDESDALLQLERFVATAMRELFPGERVVLVGHSLGGAVVLRLAQDPTHPIARVVAIDPVSFGFARWLKRLHALGLTGPRLRRTAAKHVEAGSRIAREARRPVRLDLIPKDREVLVVWGEKDQLTPPTCLARMHAQRPDLQVEVWSGAGHSPHHDDPERLIESLLKFGARCRGTAPDRLRRWSSRTP